MTEPEINPVSLAPGEGLWVENPVGGVLTFKVTAEQSNGALTAAETVAAPERVRRCTCTQTKTS